MPRAPVITIWT